MRPVPYALPVCHCTAEWRCRWGRESLIRFRRCLYVPLPRASRVSGLHLPEGVPPPVLRRSALTFRCSGAFAPLPCNSLGALPTVLASPVQGLGLATRGISLPPRTVYSSTLRIANTSFSALFRGSPHVRVCVAPCGFPRPVEVAANLDLNWICNYQRTGVYWSQWGDEPPAEGGSAGGAPGRWTGPNAGSGSPNDPPGIPIQTGPGLCDGQRWGKRCTTPPILSPSALHPFEGVALSVQGTG